VNRRGFLASGLAAAWGLAIGRGLRPGPPPLPAVTSVRWNPEIARIIQQATLTRVYRDALYPKLLFRMEADALWPTKLIS
jgi:hypothetical protein